MSYAWTPDDMPEISCEEDCTRCSGEYCEKHFNEPCDCDVVDRHMPNYKSKCEAIHTLGLEVLNA